MSKYCLKLDKKIKKIRKFSNYFYLVLYTWNTCTRVSTCIHAWMLPGITLCSFFTGTGTGCTHVPRTTHNRQVESLRTPLCTHVTHTPVFISEAEIHHTKLVPL